jgi:K+-sensing histidine kinase KdpD
MDAKPTRQLNGAGAAWAAGGLATSLLIGVLIEPFRGTIGLENVTIVYLATVVLTAAFGGRAAGLLTATTAALSYDFFLTTPYHSLAIDSPAQVITVGLLLAIGLVAGLAGRVQRQLTLAVDEQAELIGLLNMVAQAAAHGENADQIAAEQIRRLLDARRVAIQRTSEAGMLTVADAGDRDVPLDTSDLLHLDEDGRALAREHLVRTRGLVAWRTPERGLVFDLIQYGRPVGCLVVVRDHSHRASPLTRLALATVAETLATIGPTHSDAEPSGDEPYGS